MPTTARRTNGRRERRHDAAPGAHCAVQPPHPYTSRRPVGVIGGRPHPFTSRRPVVVIGGRPHPFTVRPVRMISGRPHPFTVRPVGMIGGRPLSFSSGSPHSVMLIGSHPFSFSSGSPPPFVLSRSQDERRGAAAPAYRPAPLIDAIRNPYICRPVGLISGSAILCRLRPTALIEVAPICRRPVPFIRRPAQDERNRAETPAYRPAPLMDAAPIPCRRRPVPFIRRPAQDERNRAGIPAYRPAAETPAPPDAARCR